MNVVKLNTFTSSHAIFMISVFPPGFPDFGQSLMELYNTFQSNVCLFNTTLSKMAEAKMSTQTITENLPVSNTHPSHHGESPKQTEKVTTFHLYDPAVSTSLLKGIMLSPCQLNTEINGVVDMPDDDQQNKTNTTGRSIERFYHSP